MNTLTDNIYVTLALGNVAVTAFLIWFVTKSSNRLVYRACDFFDSKSGSLIITVLGVSWAAQVSIYANELKDQITSYSVGFELYLFIFVISLMLIFLLMKEHGQSRRIKIKEDKLKDQLTNLPPKKILTFIAEQNEKISHMVQKLRLEYLVLIEGSAFTKEDLNSFKTQSDSRIKYILAQMAEASYRWDDDYENLDNKYRSNIFIPSPSHSLTPLAETKTSHPLKASLENSPFFLFNDNVSSRISHSDGVLFCQKQYSTEFPAAKANEGAAVGVVDNHIISFPYTNVADKPCGKHNPNFFGAVQAYISGDVQYISDSREVLNDFLDELNEIPDYDEYVNKLFVKSVRDYYQNDSGKSILSIPMKRYEIVDPFNIKLTHEVFGVVNLYSNKRGMLLTKERAELFYEMIRPLCNNLSLILSLNQQLLEVEGQKFSETASKNSLQLKNVGGN
ncbi:TPA: hypothetical protein ACMDUI_004623 [Vibrio parahaemolyticus]|nr:hypothetical protein [Vibrio parahaemolyticus]EGR1762943.1 hypothetical protein [Vibrio parahaemolyticus]